MILEEAPSRALAVLELPLIAVPISKEQLTLAVLEVLAPIALVPRLVCLNLSSEAVLLPAQPLPLIAVVIGVGQHTPSVRFIVLPLPLVECAC